MVHKINTLDHKFDALDQKVDAVGATLSEILVRPPTLQADPPSNSEAPLSFRGVSPPCEGTKHLGRPSPLPGLPPAPPARQRGRTRREQGHPHARPAQPATPRTAATRDRHGRRWWPRVMTRSQGASASPGPVRSRAACGQGTPAVAAPADAAHRSGTRLLPSPAVPGTPGPTRHSQPGPAVPGPLRPQLQARPGIRCAAGTGPGTARHIIRATQGRGLQDKARAAAHGVRRDHSATWLRRDATHSDHSSVA
jgi:hypothetical protein